MPDRHIQKVREGHAGVACPPGWLTPSSPRASMLLLEEAWPVAPLSYVRRHIPNLYTFSMGEDGASRVLSLRLVEEAGELALLRES